MGQRRGELTPIGDGGAGADVAALRAEEKDLPIAGPARRQGRPLDEAQPQNDRIAIRPAGDVRRPGEAADAARRMRIGASGMG